MIRVTIKNNNIGKLFLQYVSVNVSRLMSQGVLWFIQSMLLVHLKKTCDEHSCSSSFFFI